MELTITDTANPKGNLIDYSNPSVEYPYDISDGHAKTLVYKIEADRFMCAFTMTPEMFGSLGTDTFAFKMVV